jgi:hypothetical protein
MKTPDALQALAALSHATRLEVFRLLADVSDGGMLRWPS